MINNLKTLKELITDSDLNAKSRAWNSFGKTPARPNDDEILDGIKIEVIERYLRKKKLEQLNKKESL